MTEIKQVNVSVCSLSFHFFFSCSRWVLDQGGVEQVRALAYFVLEEGDHVINLKPNGLRQVDTDIWLMQVRSPNQGD